MLLAMLLQLCKLLAMHTGGATDTWRLLRSGGAVCTWRHWERERRRRRRNVIKCDRGGTTVRQWWMQLSSIAQQDRCGHRSRDRWRDSVNQKRSELEVQKSEGNGIGSNTFARSSDNSSDNSSVSRDACW